MPKDINGINLKRKDIVSFVYTNFTGSVLHTELKEGIITKTGKFGTLAVKTSDGMNYTVGDSSSSTTLIERRKREVLIEKHK